ncbi:MAG: hypothetical protein IKR15_07730 [Bacteroidales bacterium]|nr:hypothetical protein [Bacteroidales bacterium]
MRRIFILIAALTVSLCAYAQADRKEVRQGNREFRKGEYRSSDVSYRKALLKDSTSVAGNYNLANNLYRQENWEEAGKYMSKLDKQAEDLGRGSDILFNEGDIAIAKQDWKAAVDAFRRSLLMNPGDLDAKENYIYAKKKLQEQQNQQNQDQNQDNKDNQDQSQDPQDQSQDPRDQSQDPQDQEKQQQPQPQDQKISPQQAQAMLKAIQAKEKETQDKVNKEKADALKAAQKDKNW